MKGLDAFARRKWPLRSFAEQRAAEALAISALRQAGFRTGSSSLEPVSLSDRTQTYRIISPQGTAILKMMPPEWSALSKRVQRFLELRGIELPAMLWSDASLGAIVYEDAGDSPIPASPNEAELVAIARYLARLHAACRIPRHQAAMEFPELAAAGFPSPAELAAQILHESFRLKPPLQRRVFDEACVLAEWVEPECVLVISDIRRDHFRFVRGRPVLLDLEMCSFWDVPPANLATLLGFPGQFLPPLTDALKQRVLLQYAEATRDFTGKAMDLDRLKRSVAAAEFLLSVTLTNEGVTLGGMLRTRPLRISDSAEFSIESELGPACFEMLTERLEQPGALTVVDLGCGEGVALSQLRRSWPYHHCVGVDLTPGSEARPSVSAAAERLPFASSSVDIILGVQLLQYLHDKLAFLGEVYRTLKPNGIALFAMTEHFLPESGFNPPISVLIERSHPAEAFQCYLQRRVGGRQVASFALLRLSDDLQFLWAYAGVKYSQTSGNNFPYLQSQYHPC